MGSKPVTFEQFKRLCETYTTPWILYNQYTRNNSQDLEIMRLRGEIRELKTRIDRLEMKS